MKFNVITLFPQFIESLHGSGLIGQAIGSQKVQLQIVNPRDFTDDTHKTVDDRPFGGGDGMVMLAEPLKKSLSSLTDPGYVVALSAAGERWNHKKAHEWSKSKSTITLVCGRYAGIDQRFIEKYVDEEISIGDYVLSGGELAACVVIDSLCRYLPGVLGHPESAFKESFEQGVLEAPQFTRPRQWEELSVPQALLSGNHAEIEKFKSQVAILWTLKQRPDLLENQNCQTLEKATKDALQMLSQLSDSERAALGLNDLSFLMQKE